MHTTMFDVVHQQVNLQHNLCALKISLYICIGQLRWAELQHN